MKKIFYSVSLFVLALFASGCGNKISETKLLISDANSQTWAGYVMSNKPYTCTVTVEQGETPLVITTYIQGSSLREEMLIEGESVQIIMNAGSTYVLNEKDVSKREELLQNCDWFLYPKQDNGDEGVLQQQAYDIGTLADAGMATYTCTPGDFDKKIFEPAGNVCDVTAL